MKIGTLEMKIARIEGFQVRVTSDNGDGIVVEHGRMLLETVRESYD
jgi:hypothetical protein